MPASRPGKEAGVAVTAERELGLGAGQGETSLALRFGQPRIIRDREQVAQVPLQESPVTRFGGRLSPRRPNGHCARALTGDSAEQARRVGLGYAERSGD